MLLVFEHCNMAVFCLWVLELGDEWRRVGHYLNVRRVRIQAIMRNNANDQENAVMDMLLTWAKKVPRSVNKVINQCYTII